MKAAVYSRYGGPEVVTIQEVEKPVPKDNEVLIRVHATTVNSGDVRLRKADPFLVRLFFGLFKPRIGVLGVDISGTVESVGQNVTAFKPGDEVFGSAYDSGLGTHAEFKCIAESAVLAKKPENLSFQESAAIFFGGHTSLHFLRKGNIAAGKYVLIYGASGALGTWAVQLGKYFGAHVTGVCSTRNVELVRSLGADVVVDYKSEDFTKNGQMYDIIYDTVGKSPFAGSVNSLKKNGRYLRADNISISSLFATAWTNLTSRKKVIGGVAHERKEDLLFLKELSEKEIVKPVIDRTYSLTEIAAAHRYVDTGRKKGSVVISLPER